MFDPNANDTSEADEVAEYTWRDRRRRVNDEQAWADMTAGVPRNVPRGTHLEDGHRDRTFGLNLMLIGMVIGSLLIIGELLANWPAQLQQTVCTP